MQVLEQKPRLQQRVASLLLWGGCGVGLLVVLGVGALRLQLFSVPQFAPQDALQVLGTVPDFTLHERSGVLVTKNDLLGKVWLAAFIFTQCAEECPLMSNQMARLQETYRAEPDFRLVSITVDPEHDTLAVLSQYASSLGAHPQRWLFLTGEKAAILHLAREGFRLGVVDQRAAQQPPPVVSATLLSQAWGWLTPSTSWAHHRADDQQNAPQALLHSARFVAVDRQGHIRHYYDSRDEKARSRLQQHIPHLLRH
jgi:cytochrome oxidase Cu insertion factor (SCO1/SenC/PrrC family)